MRSRSLISVRIPAACGAARAKTADGYRLTGAKKWIGNGTIADVAIVWAKVEGEDGIDPESAGAIRGFLVEKGTPGFTAALIEGKLSLRAALTAELNSRTAPSQRAHFCRKAAE